MRIGKEDAYGVPDLYLNELSIDLYVLRAELHSDCSIVLTLESPIDELREEA